jgi:hypothetical protein
MDVMPGAGFPDLLFPASLPRASTIAAEGSLWAGGSRVFVSVPYSPRYNKSVLSIFTILKFSLWGRI